jgi:hypothetical protein
MNELDIKDQHGKEIDDFFSNILLTECKKIENEKNLDLKKNL